MAPASVIIAYAAILLGVSALTAKFAKRPFVPVPNVQQKDGTYDYLPAHTITGFVLISLYIVWISSYTPPPPWTELIAIAITNTGWFMLGLLVLIRKENFRVVGFEGRKQVFWGGIGFLIAGFLLTNRDAIAQMI